MLARPQLKRPASHAAAALGQVWLGPGGDGPSVNPIPPLPLWWVNPASSTSGFAGTGSGSSSHGFSSPDMASHHSGGAQSGPQSSGSISGPSGPLSSRSSAAISVSVSGWSLLSRANAASSSRASGRPVARPRSSCGRADLACPEAGSAWSDGSTKSAGSESLIMLMVTPFPSASRQRFRFYTTMIWQAMGLFSSRFSQACRIVPSQYNVPEGPPPSRGLEFWGWRRAGSAAAAGSGRPRKSAPRTGRRHRPSRQCWLQSISPRSPETVEFGWYPAAGGEEV
jgi:hypothetical protein